LLVRYTELPEAVEAAIAPHFGVRVSEAGHSRMAEFSAFHAKHPRRRFEADGESKRQELADEARAMSDRWIRPAYEELERLRKP
jgi:hypothetical protein